MFSKLNTWFVLFLALLVVAGGFISSDSVLAGGREGQPRTIFIDTTTSPRERVTECAPQEHRFIRYNIGDEIIVATDNGRGEQDHVINTYVVERVAFPKSWGNGDRGACYEVHSRIEQVVYVHPKEASGD